MKRTLFTICLVVTSAACAMAQNLVRGTVVDSKDNPIPGALVEVVGSDESAITELDGTFAINTPSRSSKIKATYAGMQSRTKSARSGMTIKLANIGWINNGPDKYNWIVTLQGAFPETGLKNPALGVMVGKVKDIGWYAKGVYHPSKSTAYDASTNTAGFTTGTTKNGYWAATAGAIVRVKGPFYGYVGAGYVDRKIALELSDGTYAKDTDQSYSGATLDYGVMFSMNHIVVTAGALTNLSGSCHFTGCIGVGISF